MKRTSVRVAALTLALGAMFAAPAAAVPSHQLPGTPDAGVTAPGTAAPTASPCQVVPWWFWCR
ncbi:hypothetical protein [Georgenia sunbinii]|uniref:hypothetical protein n=1 Tax=Georgenia sunbinii TaxID=3117728 RepID=UPI002F262E54